MLIRLSFLLIAALTIPSALNAEEYLCTPKIWEEGNKKSLFIRISDFTELENVYQGKLDIYGGSAKRLLAKRDYFRRQDWSKSLDGKLTLINEIDLKIIEENPYDLVLGKWIDETRVEGYQFTVIEKFGDFRFKSKLPVEYDHIQYFSGTIPNPNNHNKSLEFPQQKGLCKLRNKYSESDLFSINNLIKEEIFLSKSFILEGSN